MLPDNRLRFPATRLDLATEVGETSQQHETFPAAGQPPRADWLLMWFISLLSNQSSYDEPSQYRIGSLWYDLNTTSFKIYDGSTWVDLANSISINGVPLSDWATAADAVLTSATPEVTFSGRCIANNTTNIAVPIALRSQIDITNSRPFLYRNGILLDPRNISFQTDALLTLSNDSLSNGDRFTVIVRNIVSSGFHIPDVIAG